MISRERRGDFLGKTVQVVPHVTDSIQVTIEKGDRVGRRRERERERENVILTLRVSVVFRG